MAFELTNPMRFCYARIVFSGITEGVIVGYLPASPPYIAPATNFTQTTGDESPAPSGKKYGSFVIRDIPKGFGIYGDSDISASFSLIYNDEGNYDLQTQVIEAANGHKYWLDQTVDVTLYTYDGDPYVLSFTFTDEDFATSPVYDPDTGIGFIEITGGPSIYANRYSNYYVGEQLYLTNDSVTEATPHDFFQPPGG